MGDEPTAAEGAARAGANGDRVTRLERRVNELAERHGRLEHGHTVIVEELRGLRAETRQAHTERHEMMQSMAAGEKRMNRHRTDIEGLREDVTHMRGQLEENTTALGVVRTGITEVGEGLTTLNSNLGGLPDVIPVITGAFKVLRWLVISIVATAGAAGTVLGALYAFQKVSGGG